MPSIEPQVTQGAAPARDIGTPATSALADVNQRVSSLESQLASVTGQVEQTQFRLRQLEDQFAAYKRATDAKLSAGANALAATPASAMARDDGDTIGPAGRPASGRTISAKPAAPAQSPKDAARSASVAAVEKPAPTGDAAEDAYMYGYRLWTARKFPEAEAQLKSVVTDFPRSKRASYAQNLLGRSYLDEGKPSLASIAFYENYKKMPDGERAPDSLYYLGQALLKLNKPADACKVYGELTDVYGGKISATMKADVARARTTAKCS